MYADEVAAWKNVFHINHCLMGNNDVFCGVDFKIIFHSFNIDDVRKTDSEKFPFRPDKDMVAVYCFYFDAWIVLKIFPSIILSMVLENRS